MSLNCLTCQFLKRADSVRYKRTARHNKQLPVRRCSSDMAGQHWSAILEEQEYNEHREGGSVKKRKKAHHHRFQSLDAARLMDAGVEPRLVRSCGMRRDWSFEDLRELEGEKAREVRKDIDV